MKKFDYWNEDALLGMKEAPMIAFTLWQLCRLGTPAEVISGSQK